MNGVQRESLKSLWERNGNLVGIPFKEEEFRDAYNMDGLPPGYVVGWIAGMFVGCSPDGRISS